MRGLLYRDPIVSTAPDLLAARLDNRLKMRHFVLLDAIDRYRSVTRVAEQMSLAQPTVTRALADIEDIFMTPLFARTGRGLEPTAAGEVVIARARLALADNEALRRELESVRAGQQGRLRLGVIPYVSGAALDAAWRHLFALRPRIALLAHEDTTRNLIAQIRDRTLDCAICRFHDGADDDLVQELLYRQQAHLVVAASSAAPLQRRGPPDIARLADMDWIFPPANTPIRQLLVASFAAAGEKVPVPLLEAYAVRQIAHALGNLPRGITVLPREIAQAVADLGSAVVLPQPLPWELPPIGLAWLRNAPKAGLAAGLAAALRQA
jgi:DNA-binding transcriptional LysR family regulator